jgi:hypothetical protein
MHKFHLVLFVWYCVYIEGAVGDWPGSGTVVPSLSLQRQIQCCDVAVGGWHRWRINRESPKLGVQVSVARQDESVFVEYAAFVLIEADFAAGVTKFSRQD